MFLNSIIKLWRDCSTKTFHCHHRQILKIFLLFTIAFLFYSLFLWKRNRIHTRRTFGNIDVQAVVVPESFKQPGIYHFNKIIVKPDITNDKFLFLVLISSSAGSQKNRDRREAIRKTWGNCNNNQLEEALRNQSLVHSVAEGSEFVKDYYKCKVFFFVGETGNKTEDVRMKKEATVYKDVIIVGVKENYRNITWKLRSAMQFTSHFDMKYLIKTDDDVYINLPRLAEYIATGPGFSTPIYGGTTYTGKVVRDPLHRHYVHKFDYEERYYPLYCKGSMIVLSGSLLPSVVGAFAHLKPFNIDDAYLGITLNKLGVSPFKLEKIVQFQHLPVFLDYLHLCDFSWLVGVGDGLDATRIHSVHRAMTLGDSLPVWMCLHLNLYPLICLLLVAFFAVAVFKARNLLC